MDPKAHSSLPRCLTLLTAILLVAAGSVLGQNSEVPWVIHAPLPASDGSEFTFPLVAKGIQTKILVDGADHPGVKRIARVLAEDIGRVTDRRPEIATEVQHGVSLLIVGTIGLGGSIDKLAAAGKIDLALLEGKREKFITTVVGNPFPGIESALVIAGSDKRGTIYGMFALSKQMGVSPWYWWADVPVPKQPELHVVPGVHTDGEPQVRYRGIFINDEAPALSGWAFEKFGGFNSKFYDKVFELILRMRGNFLWPAMWGRMFYVEDTENARLADEYGIVIGTSHHEPMMRAHAEWEKFGNGPWDYTKNAKTLEEFWRGGFERSLSYESLVTIGMRGDGDEPMTEGTAISLLESIVKKQREIIADVTKKPASETQQVWALYKEVQDYYDKGMRVPDDVTLLFADDNWGNIRRLPDPKAPPRKGGYGIYYHYDYVGGPRSYKWTNTNQIERVWEQMTLAYGYGADRLWIVNVGDIKPMELPTEFFLDLAWDPEAIAAEDLPGYYRNWARVQFRQEAWAIAEVLALYTKYNSRRKPELLDADTYSLEEWQRVLTEWEELERKTLMIKKNLPEESLAAYFQLVEYPVLASSNLNKMYRQAAMNRELAERCEEAANVYADGVEFLFKRDAELEKQYHEIAGGKWNHMMSQTRIGYTNWQQPEKNVMPKTSRVPSSTVQGSRCEGRAEPQSTEGANAKKGSFVSIDAASYSNAFTPERLNWITIPNLGLTGSAVTLRPAAYGFPWELPSPEPPRLEYSFDIPFEGDVIVRAYFSPTLDFLGTGGLRYSLAFDNGDPIEANLHENWSEAAWEKAVAENIIVKETVHRGINKGKRSLIFRPLSSGIVLQKIVIYRGELPGS